MWTTPRPWFSRRVLPLVWRGTVALALVLGPLLLTPRTPLHATSSPTPPSSSRITPATGGASLSLDDTAAAGGNNLLAALGGPVYEEQASGDIGAGRITLRPPAGFEFDETAVVTVAVTPAADAICLAGSDSATRVNFSDRATATVTRTTLHVGVTRASVGGDRCKLTWAGIRVRQTGTAPVSGALTTASDGALIAGNVGGVTSWGDLSSVPGQQEQLLWQAQPLSGAAGIPWLVQPTIGSRDRFGNLRASDSASPVTLTLASGGAPGAALVCAEGRTRVLQQGVARFTGCAIDLPGSGYRLRASSGAAVSDSDAFDVGAGPAARLLVVAQPGGASGGSPFATQPVVHLTDAAGNLITAGPAAAVTAALLDDPATGGRLLGATTVLANGGVARFDGLAVDRAGTGYRLRFTADSGAPALESAPFSVAVGPPHALQTASGDGQTGRPGVRLPQPLVAAIVDRGGNPVAGADVRWTLAATAGPGAALQDGAAVQTTDAQGRVSIMLLLGTAPGAYAVSASCPACPPASGTVVFTATAVAPPTITAVSPSVRGQGAPAADVVITGVRFQPDSTITFDGDGVTVNSTRVDSTEQITVNLTVASGAEAGPRALTIGGSSGTVTQPAVFAVTPAPLVAAVQPATLSPGQADQLITVTGSGFVAGVTVMLNGSGTSVIARDVTVESDTRLRATLALPDNAAPGLRTLTLVNPDGGRSASGPVASLPGALTNVVLALATTMPGATTSASLVFITAQAVPGDGSIVLTFPADTSPAAVTVAAAAVAGTACPGASATVAGQAVTVALGTAAGCAVNAGDSVSLSLSGIVNASNGGSPALAVAIETRTAGGLVLDQGTATAVATVFPTPTPSPTPTNTPVVRSSGGGGGGGGGSGATRTPTPSPSPTPTPSPRLPGADLPAPPVQATRAVVSTSRTDRVSAGSVSVEVPARVAGSGGGSTITITVDPVPIADGAIMGTVTQSVTPRALRPLEGFAAGTLAFRVEMRDSGGRQVTHLARPIILTVPYGREDLRLGGGIAAGIELHRLDEAEGRWLPLDNQQHDPTASVLAAESLRVGLFALMVEVPPPGLTGPADGAVVVDLAPVLAWSPPATTTWHQVQVLPVNGDGPALNLIIGDRAAVAAGRYAVVPPEFGAGPYQMLPGMTYTWRVRASTSLLSPGEDSPGWSRWQARAFRTGAPTSATITLTGPPQNGAAASLTPVLRWANRNGRIFYYEVQVSQNPAFETDPARAVAAVYWNLVHGGVTEPPNSYTLPEGAPLEPGKVYHWRVRPRVQGDGTPVDWTPAATFRTP